MVCLKLCRAFFTFMYKDSYEGGGVSKITANETSQSKLCSATKEINSRSCKYIHTFMRGICFDNEIIRRRHCRLGSIQIPRDSAQNRPSRILRAHRVIHHSSIMIIHNDSKIKKKNNNNTANINRSNFFSLKIIIINSFLLL